MLNKKNLINLMKILCNVANYVLEITWWKLLSFNHVTWTAGLKWLHAWCFLDKLNLIMLCYIWYKLIQPFNIFEICVYVCRHALYLYLLFVQWRIFVMENIKLPGFNSTSCFQHGWCWLISMINILIHWLMLFLLKIVKWNWKYKSSIVCHVTCTVFYL